jgi:hypothetical protein
MSKIVTALIGSGLALIALWFGLRFHFGSWYIEGVWSYVGSAVVGAIIALIVRDVLRKHFR